MMFPRGEQSFPSFYLYIKCQRSFVIALLGFGKPCLAFTLRIIPYSLVVCKGGFQTFLLGHGDECCPRLSLLKRQVPNCSATPWLKSSIKAQALDPGLMTSPQEDSQCSTLSLYFYILDWLFPVGNAQSALNSIVKDRCPCPWTWGLNLIWLALLHSRALPSLVSTLHIISHLSVACKGGFLKNFWDDLFLFRSSHLPCFP